VHPQDKVKTAARFIMAHRYRRLPVVDTDNRFVGVFGVDCLLRLVLPKAVVMEDGLNSVEFVRETLSDLHRRFKRHEDEPISMCMEEQEVEVVHPDTPLLETLLVLYRTRASLPVVEKDTNRLVGAISYWDAGKKIYAAEV
jgi:CBS domain-containing protein